MAREASAAPGMEHRAGRARTDGFAFARHVLAAVAVTVSVGLLLALVWYAADLLMLVFAGVLVSILLRRLAALVRRMTGLGHGVSVAIVVLTLAAVTAAFGWLVAERIATESRELMDQLQAALDTVRARLDDYEWGRQLPPVVTISTQLLLGIMFGFIGLLVASPVAAAVMIVVEMVYVEDVLGDVVTTDRGGRPRPAEAGADQS